MKLVYTGDRLMSKDPVIQQPFTAVEWVLKRHEWAKNHIQVDPDTFLFDWSDPEPYVTYALDKKQELEIKKIKQKDNNFLFATAFGDIDNPQTPDRAPRKTSENGGVLRQFIGLDYDLITLDEAKELSQNVHQLLIHQQEANVAMYPSISYPWKPRFRVVIDTKQWLDKKTYKKAVEHVIEYLGVDPHDESNYTLAKPLNSPLYLHESSARSVMFQTTKKPLNLTRIGFDPEEVRRSHATKKATRLSSSPSKKNDDDQDEPIAPYRSDQIIQAVDTFLASDEAREQIEDYDYFWRFAESLADAYMRELVDRDFIDYTLRTVALGDAQWEEDNLNVFETQLSKLEESPDKRQLVRPLSTYLPIASEVKANNPDVRNLSQLLASLLPSTFEPSGKYSVQDAADTIGQFFEFGLLPGIEDDAEALAIFDPLNGIWTHSNNDFIAMLNVIKPAITPTQVKTATLYWAAQANRSDTYIRPYDGSQYLVFKNTVLDISTMQTHDLGSEKVKRQQFTKRHQMIINYDPDPELIDYPTDSLNGQNWNVEQFISAYAHNDEDIRKYFLFGLALGLFAGHNSGVHFDIQGESGSGKSTLAYIFRGLYGSQRVAEILFSDLNKEFPITNYNHDTTVIWVKESNTGTSPLDDDHGTPFYDGLADGYARIPVKHAGDQIVANPPQVYIDGTQLIQSNDIRTGPARRTLAYKLPSPIEPYRKQFYSNNIHERLMTEENLQYMVMQMIQAFRTIVPEHRLDNFKLNLGVKHDLDMLPNIAKEWRQDFVSADSNMRQWYDDMVSEFILTDNMDAWLTDSFFYELYLHWYEQRNPQDRTKRFARRLPNFTDILYQIFEEVGLHIITFKDAEGRNRSRITSPDKWGIHWDEYDENHTRPARLLDIGQWSEVYKKRVKNIYRLVTSEPDERLYDKESPLVYHPKESTRVTQNQLLKTSSKTKSSE